MEDHVLTGTAARLANHLWSLKNPRRAIEIDLERGFSLKYHDAHPDAPRSPYLLNLRTRDNPKPGPLDEEALGLIAEAFRELLSGTKVTHLVPIPNAADPIAEKLGVLTRLPVLRLVKDVGDGKRRIVRFLEDPVLMVRDQLALIDDVISEADTKLEALAVLWDERAHIELLLVVVDRQQGGREHMLARKVTTRSVLTISGLFTHYMVQGWITRAERDAVLAYPTLLRDYQMRIGEI